MIKEVIKIKVIAFHFLFWLVYILSEYLANLFHLDGPEHFKFIRVTIFSLPIIVIPAYFLAIYAVPVWLKKERRLLFAIAILLSMGFVFYGRIKWMELINYLEYNSTYRIPASKVLKNVIRDYSVIALAICIYIISDWRKKAKLNLQLIESKAKVEMQLLKSQLHPHFLFNTLNNIYSLALKKSDLTAEYILKLSHLLDYLVYQTDNERVKLALEIELIKNYINLEKLRHGDVLKVDLNISGVSEAIKTPPLILLPFIENCFKHGGKNEKGFLDVKININIYEHLLIMNVENTKKKKVNINKNSGVGLENVKKRFDLLYHKKHKLTIEEDKNNYSVKLELEIR